MTRGSRNKITSSNENALIREGEYVVAKSLTFFMLDDTTFINYINQLIHKKDNNIILLSTLSLEVIYLFSYNSIVSNNNKSSDLFVSLVLSKMVEMVPAVLFLMEL